MGISDQWDDWGNGMSCMTSTLWIGHLGCTWGYLGSLASQTTMLLNEKIFLLLFL